MNSTKQEGLLWAGLLWIACATQACGGGDGGSSSAQPPTAPPKVVTMSLSRDTATLVPTALVQLTATPKDGSGNSLSRTISWTSSDESKARVSSGGEVTGVAAGVVTISASTDGITAQARITVKEGAIVGTSGGSVSALAGSVGLDVPAGAFAQAAMLTVERPSSLPVDPRLVGETAVLLDAGTATISQPLQLRLKFASEKVPSGPPERLLRLHALRNAQWTPLTSGVDGTAKVVSGAVQQLGTYAVLTPAFVAGVVIGTAGTDLKVGDTLTLNARAVDQSNNTLADREIVWRSSDASVITVHSQTGLVTAVGAGSASVSATIEGRSAALQFSSVEPVKSIAVQLPQPLAVWTSVQLVAVTKDRNGNALNGRRVVWASSDSLVAQVNSAGVLEGMGPGAAVISATSEGVVGSVSVLVPVQQPVTISAISPSPLLRGTTATVTGSNFARRVSDNRVSVAGSSAQVLSSTASQLQFLVPNSGLPCQTTAAATVAVARVGSTAVSVSAQLTVQSTRTLSLGAEPLYLDASNAACISVAATAGQEYLIAVSNAQSSATSLAGFDLIATKAVPATDVSRIQIEPLRDASQSPRAFSARSLQQLPVGAPIDPHISLLERNRAEFARRGSPVAAMAAARRGRLSADRASRSISATIGALSAVRVPDLSATDFCNSNATIQARTVYVGQKSIIVEDVASPLAGQIDSYLTQIGQQFDTQQYPVLTSYFGNPLALDSQLDNNGRLVMVFSPKINLVSGVLGFVVSCDFYPQTMLSSSNEGEIFYARIPTTLTGNTTAAAPGWFWSIRSTVIHESKHLASYAERISRGGLTNPPLEAAWLEEGTARHAEELWARSFDGASWRSNANYSTAIRCDLRWTDPSCVGRAFVMTKHFGALYDYFWSNEYRSVLGRTTSTDASFYGSAWSLVRWTMDTYASSETGFLSALVQDHTRSGIANLEARAGVSFSELLGRWSVASWMDDRTGYPNSPSSITIPSWNTRDAFAGLSADDPFNYPYSSPYSSYGPTSAIWRVKTILNGGTATWIWFRPTSTAAELLTLGGYFGGAAPSTIALTLVRVK